MTNAEKFKEVFGVRYEDFRREDLYRAYHKMKKYKVTLVSWRFDRNPITIIVNASGRGDARERAIEAFGDEYVRFESGAPAYKLIIEQADTPQTGRNTDD